MMRLMSVIVATSCFSLGCGPRSDGTGDEQKGTLEMEGETGAMDTLDTSEAGLIAFVKEKKYASWRAEPAAHDTAGPHGDKVRTFFNTTLATSLEAGSATHPKGSVTVKELLAADGTTITGHALDVKVEEGAGKTTWLFFEGFVSDAYKNNFYGVAHPTCHGCHESGSDYVLSALP